MNEMNTKTLKESRAVVSSLLIVIFAIIFITGMGLKYGPSGKGAKETNWTFLGIEKETLKDIHTYLGIMMGLVIVIHLSLNYKMFKGEIKAFVKK